MSSHLAETIPSGAWVRVLVAPHDRLGRSGMGLLTAATSLLLGLLASRFGIRFDGFLSVSLAGNDRVPLVMALADQFVSLPLAAGVAWLILRVFAREAHFDKLLLSIGTMRAMLVLIAPLVMLIDRPLALTPLWLLLTLISVLGIWTLILLITGVSFASGFTGRRLAGATLCIIIAAELISKQTLTLLIEWAGLLRA